MSSDKAAQLREMLENGRLVKLVGAHTPVSARLVERHGFDGVWASGLEISTSHCVPDAGILTMTEMLEAARAMNEVIDLPVVSDCDTGFGDTRNVVHMMHRYEAAGIAAVCIEDKQFPKLNSFLEGSQDLAPIELFQEKIAAAKAAQTSPTMMVIARIEAFIAGRDLKEALKRAHSYADAGADAILIHSKEKKPDEVISFAKAWRSQLPLVVVPTTYYHTSDTELQSAGANAIIYANHVMRAAVKAMDDTLTILKASHSTACIEKSIAPLHELFELQHMSDVVSKTRPSLETIKGA